MDIVFEEEKLHLQKTESKLKSEIEKHKSLSQKYVDELNDYEPSGLGPTKAELREAYKREDALVDTFETYVDEPYFGRMDLDVNGSTKTETYYIGKEGITINQIPIVVDWRSKVGEYFYMKSEHSFEINDYKYQLAIRRALDIKKGKLLGYNTEYDTTNVSLEGDVMDPFLITVLRDKRREHRLTDIIRTIQGKQNEIIRKPREEQFVVQGCAGSGKTMILLHRLSYLKFNNRDLNWKNVKIITPNKTFEAHINDLSLQLGLDEIERLSVDEYYVRLIRLYSDKIRLSSEVESEKSLNEDLLSLIYSEEYKNELEKRYENRWISIIEHVLKGPLMQLIEKYNLRVPDFSKHTQATYLGLLSSIKDIKSIVNKQNEERKTLLEQIQRAKLLVERRTNEKNKAEADLKVIRSKSLVSLNNELMNIEEIKASMEQQMQKVFIEAERISVERKTAKQNRDKEQKKYQSFVGYQNELLNFDSFERRINSKDEIAILILKKVKKEYDEIAQLEEEYRKIPLYRFVVRNQMNENIKSKKHRFSVLVMRSVEEISKSLRETVELAEEEYSNVDAKYKSFEQERKASEEKYKRVCDFVEASSCAIEKMTNELSSDLSHDLTSEQYLLIESMVSDYVDVINVIKDSEKKIEIYQENGRGYAEKLIELEKESITELDIQMILETEIEVDKLRLDLLLKDVVISCLSESYREKGVKYSKKNYRHKLYLMLLFCTMYFTSNRIYDSFINIDEAQDISLSEYRLLRKVLGSRCVFNLYGDVNQLVYSYKGINDWELLAELVSPNVYVLNENYRNTLQITEFCNRTFSSEVYPIGVTGDEVVDKSLKLSVDWLISIKKNNPEYRCAIIYRHGKAAVIEALSLLMNDIGVSWNVVDDAKISVITVEVAKGLEFEAVVAIVDAMTVNEKYISFTRALNNLCVVNEQFAEIDKQDTYVEQDDENEMLVISEEADYTQENLSLSINNSKELAIKEANISSTTDIGQFAENVLNTAFDESIMLGNMQKEVMATLDSGIHSACNGQSGSFKSMIFWIMVLKARRETGKQSIISAECFLQENELVMAEKIGLTAGYIGESVEDFSKDVKREKYDVIFVPFEFLKNQEETNALLRLLDGKIKYWGIDHPLKYSTLWDSIKNYGMALKATFFLMSKEGFGDMNLEGYRIFEMKTEGKHVEEVDYSCDSITDKWAWIDNNIDVLNGVGIIYCNDVETCKMVSKYLKKKKIKAPEYVDTNNIELMHYLTNSFISGGVNVLVTTQELGKNLSNPRMNFVIHFDVPTEELLLLHKEQILGTVHQAVFVNLE